MIPSVGLHRRYRFLFPDAAPHRETPNHISNPACRKHPNSSSRTLIQPHASFCGKVSSEEPYKPHISGNRMSSTGAIRCIQSKFIMSRPKSPFDRPNPAYVMHSDNETTSPPHILPGTTNRYRRRHDFRTTCACSSLQSEGGVVADSTI